jgi:hypothetical protein
MPVMRRSTFVFSALAVAFAASSPGSARADEKAACVAASDQAQTLRDEGKYRLARTSLGECARDACPTIVRKECERWLGELDAAQPTLVLGARDPRGNDVAGTRVLMDGAPLVERLDGRPVAVDPGEHVFRYEAPGAASVEQRVVVRVNEKNRTLTAILMQQQVQPGAASAAAASSSSSSSSPGDAAAPADGTRRAPVPVITWVLIGVTGLAAGSFAFFGISGENDIANMRATCAPNCAQSQVDSARLNLNLADVSLGVGVASLVTAGIFLFTRGYVPKATSAAFDLVPDLEARPGGGVATIRARF